jgi:hypothetical protein
MDLDELKENIEIVFAKAESDQKDGSSFFYRGSHKDEEHFTYPNSEPLIDIFAKIKDNALLKAYFINILKTAIISTPETVYYIYKQNLIIPFYISPTPLCFYALLKVGYADEATECLNKRSSYTSYEIYRLLNEIIDWGYFDDNNFKKILIKIRTDNFVDLNQTRKNLEKQIVNARFERLKKKIRIVNVEINQDQKLVTEKISSLGLNPNYNELLSCIERYILSENPKPVNAGMINNLRTFMADLLKEIATKVAEIEHEVIPKERDSEMGNIRNYLTTKLGFSSKDDKFIDSFINILHAEGGHSFVSEQEYFRLARNIAIEIALFILSKYENKYRK